jgi:hypothetical protein
VVIAEHAVAGPHDGRGFALDEHPEGLAIARQDGVDDGAVIERRRARRVVDREIDGQRSSACQSSEPELSSSPPEPEPERSSSSSPRWPESASPPPGPLLEPEVAPLGSAPAVAVGSVVALGVGSALAVAVGSLLAVGSVVALAVGSLVAEGVAEATTSASGWRSGAGAVVAATTPPIRRNAAPATERLASSRFLIIGMLRLYTGRPPASLPS